MAYFRENGFSGHQHADEAQAFLRSSDGEISVFLHFDELYKGRVLEALVSFPVDSDFERQLRTEFPELRRASPMRKLRW